MSIFTKQQKPLTEILQTTGNLARIIEKASALGHLEKSLHLELSQLLSVSMKENPQTAQLLQTIHVAHYEHGRLHLLCDNAATSTRLRYLIPELIKRLRNKNILPTLINIELSVSKVVNFPPHIAASKTEIRS